MSGVGEIISALAVLIPAVASAVVLVLTTIREGRTRPEKTEKAAKTAAEETASVLLDALADGLADGKLTETEINSIRQAIVGEPPPETEQRKGRPHRDDHDR